MKPNPDRLFPADQVRDFVKRAIGRVGTLGWDYLSHEMKSALIAQHALRVVAGLDRGEIPCAAIHCLHIDMLTAAGLLE